MALGRIAATLPPGDREVLRNAQLAMESGATLVSFVCARGLLKGFERSEEALRLHLVRQGQILPGGRLINDPPEAREPEGNAP